MKSGGDHLPETEQQDGGGENGRQVVHALTHSGKQWIQRGRDQPGAEHNEKKDPVATTRRKLMSRDKKMYGQGNAAGDGHERDRVWPRFRCWRRSNEAVFCAGAVSIRGDGG